MIRTTTDWNSLYISGNTGWDMKQVSPPLKYFIDRLDDRQTAILIPGCGNAYEAAYLLDKGFTNVTLVDISAHLVDSLKAKFQGRDIQIIRQDFFEHKGAYELILEQTFFCAIDPSQRQLYAKQTSELLADDGTLAGVMFNHHYGFPDHPPYSGSEAEYRKLFDPYFEIVKMELSDISIAPRQGNELIVEFKKLKKPAQAYA